MKFKYPAKFLEVTVSKPGGVVRWVYHKKELFMSTQLFVGQSITLSVIPRDAAFKVGFVDGPPTWELDTTGVVAIEPASDGTSCKCTAIAPGSCELTPKALADAVPIQGNPIDFTNSPPPLQPAVTLEVIFGPIVTNSFGRPGVTT